jgi:glycosyltransferase involved in cell wall biosynthesis
LSKVSVILTSYNHARFLRDAIESVLNQTFTDFELIIGDDASTDESWNIIQSYTDPRIYAYRHETNKGAGTINEIILSGRASGEYIAIHHSDDVWELEKLEKQVAYLDKNPQVGAVFTDIVVIGEHNQPLEDNTHIYQTAFNQPNRSRHEWLNHFFYKGNALCHPTILIRKECYDTCGLYRFGLAQLADFDMWVRLCMQYEIYVLPEKLFRMRVLSAEMNSSGNRSDVRIRGWFEYLQVLYNYEQITSSNDLAHTFPNMKKYLKPEGYDPGFVLGMAALESGTYNITKLFGLELLLEALNTPIRAEIINKVYDFGNINFTSLTGQNDIFSYELVASLQDQIKVLETQNAEKDQSVNLLNEILNSRAWKLVSTYRRISSRLFHTP